jgi:hypothetical protein
MSVVHNLSYILQSPRELEKPLMCGFYPEIFT